MTTTTDLKFSRNKYGQYVACERVTMWGERKLVSFTITKGKPSYNGFSGWVADWRILSGLRGDSGTVDYFATLAEAKVAVAQMVAQGYGTV